MTILHFKVVLAAIFIKININNRKIRPYSQFYSLITSKCVPLILGLLFDVWTSLYGDLEFSIILFCSHLVTGYTIVSFSGFSVFIFYQLRRQTHAAVGYLRRL